MKREISPTLDGAQLENKLVMTASLITSATVVFVAPDPGTDNVVTITRPSATVLDINVNGVDNLFNAQQSHMVWVDGGAEQAGDHLTLLDKTTNAAGTTLQNTTLGDTFVFGIGGAGWNDFEGGAGIDCFLAGSGHNKLDAGSGYNVLIGNSQSNDTVINLSDTGSGFVLSNGATVNHSQHESGSWFIMNSW